MAGTRIGGLKASKTMKLRYGATVYESIGRKGGEISRGGGFAKDHELARTSGRKGGSVKSLSCNKGHLYEPDNFQMVDRGGYVSRRCLTCYRAATLRKRNSRWEKEKQLRLEKTVDTIT